MNTSTHTKRRLTIIAISGAALAVAGGLALGGLRREPPTAKSIAAESERYDPRHPTTRFMTAARRRMSELDPPPSSEAVLLPNGAWGMPLPDGTFRMSTVEFDSNDSTIEGAISVRQMLHDNVDLARTVQSGVSKSSDERAKCLADLSKRGHPIETYSTWNIALKFETFDNLVRVTDVKSLEGTWPVEFDAEARECYEKSFAMVNFESNTKIDLMAEYPLCVQPEIRKTKEVE